MFITLEGNEGAGKTTAAMKIKDALEKEGYEVLYTREPGGSKIAEAIRDILLDPKNTNMDPRTEAILYAASRRQHLKEIVEPALQEGKIVLCDRFVDSSLAYQGKARNLGMDEIWNLNQFAIDKLMPELTLLLLVDVETGLERAQQRGELNRLDAEKLEFHQLVKKGYLELADKYPERIQVIDANKDADSVFEACMDKIHERLKNG